MHPMLLQSEVHITNIKALQPGGSAGFGYLTRAEISDVKKKKHLILRLSLLSLTRSGSHTESHSIECSYFHRAADLTTPSRLPVTISRSFRKTDTQKTFKQLPRVRGADMC